MSDYCSPDEFPGYSNSTVLFLCSFLSGLTEFVDGFSSFDIYIYLISILINIFHSIILTRKSMRSSSINILMAGVAFCDAISQFQGIFEHIKSYTENLNECWQNDFWYKMVFVENKLFWIQSTFRRYSTWLSFSIALIRTLVIRYPMSNSFEKLSKPKSAFLLMTLLIVITVPLTVLGYFEYTETYNGEYVCDEEGTTYVSYLSGYTELFMENEGRLSKVLDTAEGFVSKIIPCILYPIATFFLVIELRKVSKARKTLVSTNASNDSGKTTKLILCLTLTFFFAEFPLGLVFLWQSYTSFANGADSVIHSMFIYNFYTLFMLILSINTCTHMVICMLMSVQYRDTLKSMLLCGVSRTESETSNERLSGAKSTKASRSTLPPVG